MGKTMGAENKFRGKAVPKKTGDDVKRGLKKGRSTTWRNQKETIV